MKKTFFTRLTLDKCAMLYERFGNIFLATNRREKLNNKDFTIISNNCWGGHVYRHFGLPYSSPTVGLYFFADEYIRFISNLETYIYEPLRIIKASESKYYSELKRKKQLNVPIGVLANDIEIVFLHYKSEEEAIKKWNRRVERVNLDNLIVKFSEMNLCKIENILQFEKINFRKKLLFLSKPVKEAPDGIIVQRYTNDDEIIDDTTYYSSFIDLTDFINRRS